MDLNSDSGVNTIESPDVELTGRRFPSQWEEPRSRPKNRIRKLTQEPRADDLSVLIGHEIRSRLPWSRLPTSIPDVQPLVEAYIGSLTQLDRFRKEVENLIRVACETNLEFRQQSGETHEQARDAALQAKLGEMLSAAAVDWLPTRNIIDARLVSRPVNELRQQLDAALDHAVSQFCVGFFESLAKLVDRELFGLVEWLPNNCCSYHFFKRVVIQENEGAQATSVKTKFHSESEPDPETGRRIVGTRTTTTTRGSGKHQHRLARHQHDVMNAFHTSIGNSNVVMPPQVTRLCQAVPEWLHPFVRVIDGTIFRERIVERDTGVENWQDVQIHDEPIVGWEPGVVIGPYVLTGWGPREVRAEQQRRETAQQSQDLQDAAKVGAVERFGWTVGFLLTALGGIILLSGPSLFWAIVSLLASMFAMTQVVRSRSQAEMHNAGLLHYVAGLAVASGIITAAMLFTFAVRFDRPQDGLWAVGALVATGVIWGVGNRFLWPAPKLS